MVGSAGPYVPLIGLCLFTAVQRQLISQTATAMIVIPIAVAVIASYGSFTSTDCRIGCALGTAAAVSRTPKKMA